MNSYRQRRLRAWCLVILTIITLVLPPHIVFANPNGGVVVGGSATINQAGPVTTINQATDRAIINWQGFSIDRGELTQFNMPSTTSAVLNRVTGGNPSSILGALQANGQVYLINPSGIVFGQGAQVHVGGLVASTLDVANSQFMEGGTLHFSGNSDASVVNYGRIRAITGDIYMIGHNVQNHGVLEARQGTVGLAAGGSVMLVDGVNKRLVVQASARNARVTNTGTVDAIRSELIANGGNVYALAINNDGNIRATGAEITPEGRIVLKANGGRIVNNGELVAKNAGGSGGEVTIDSGDGGQSVVTGRIDVSGTGAGQTGGNVKVLGEDVHLAAGASIDASGHSGGGAVLVGGDFQGKNPNVRNARQTYVGRDVRLSADAVSSGDGGKVIVWSDEVTRFFGTISARGGTGGGNGGFAEVSGKENLMFAGSVDLSAQLGTTGTLLLDPEDILIADGGGAADDGQLADSTILFAEDSGMDYTISEMVLEGLTSNIILQAGQDITINNLTDGNLNLSGIDTGESIVLQAGRHIAFSDTGDTLTTAGGAVHFEADSPHSPAGGADDIGSITLGNVTTGGGDATLIASANSITITGVLNVGTGNVTLGPSTNTGINIATGGFITNGDLANINSTGRVTIGQVTTAGADGAGTSTSTLTATSINFLDSASLSWDMKLVSSGTITFQDTVDGAHDLTLIGGGDAVFEGQVGSTTPLGDGTGAALLLNMAGAGGMEFQDTVQTASGITQADGVGAVTFMEDVTVAAGDTGSSFGGNLVLDDPLTFDADGAVTIGSDGGDALTISGALVTIDTATNNNQVEINAATTLNGDLTITAGSGTIRLDGTINGGNDLILNTTGTTDINGTIGGTTPIATITTNAGGTTDIGADIRAQGGTMTFNDPVTLTGDITLTDTGGTGITFNSTVDAGDSLTLAVSGTTTFVGGVGATSAIGDGTGAAMAINSTGATEFQNTVATDSGIAQAGGAGTVTFLQDVTIAAGDTGTTFNGNVVLGGLTLDADGTVTFGDAGTDTLTVSTGLVTIDTMTNNSAVDINSATTLSSDLTVSAGSGTITLDGTINGGNDLILNTTGMTDINGAIGQTTELASVTTNATGTTQVGANVAAGQMTFNDAVLLDTQSITLSGTNAGGGATFANTVNGAQDLTLSIAGATTFVGTVGNSAAIGDGTGSAITVNSTGSTTFQNTVQTAAGITQADGAGTLQFDQNVTTGGTGANAANAFNANVVLDGLNFSSAGTVTLGNAGADTLTVSGAATTVTTAAANQQVTVNSATTLNADLTVSSGSANIVLNGTIDGNNDLVLDSTGTTDINGVIGGNTPVASLTTNAGGTTEIGANISAQGSSQTYNDPVVLTSSVTLTDAGTISFEQTVDGPHDLTLAGGGDAVFKGRVGNTAPLGDGTGAALLLNMTGAGGMEFQDTVQTASGITQADGAGPVTFRGNVTVAAGNTGSSFGGNLVLDGLTFDAEGTVTIGTDGGADTLTISGVLVTIDTSSANTQVEINAATTLDGDLTINAGSGTIQLDGTIDGNQALVLNTTGTTDINGVIGGTTPVASVTTNTGGSTEVGANVSSQGSQTYNDPVVITTDVAFNSLASDITFGGTVKGQDNATDPHNLTVSATAGTVWFKGAVGGDGFINAIDIDAATLTQGAAITGQGQVDIDVTNPLEIGYDLIGGADMNITVTAADDGPGPNPDPFRHTADTIQLTSTTARTLTIQADDMALGSTINAGTAHTVVLRSYNDGQKIDLGTNGNVASKLELTDTELETITAGTLQVGHAAAGNLVVTDPIELTDISEALLLRTGGTATVDAADIGKSLSVGLDDGTVDLQAGQDVTLTAGGGFDARIGSVTGRGDINVNSLNGNVTLTASNNRAAIGHKVGGGNIYNVTAGRNLTLHSSGNGYAQIGHDDPDATGNIRVGWDQINWYVDGDGRLTMTSENPSDVRTAITAGGPPDRVQLFGTRRDGPTVRNDLIDGANINGSYFRFRDADRRVYPDPPPEDFNLYVEFFDWPYERWGGDLTIDRAASLPYADHFAFYYTGPHVHKPTFYDFLNHTHYDRFIRVQDISRTVEPWLLGYQQWPGSIWIDPHDPWQPELASSGGGVNAQGAE